jgi:hypothetical protein
MPKALLLGYDPEQPSFRHRMCSLVSVLQSAGWTVAVERFPSGRYGLRTWERRSLLSGADVVVLHQIKLSAMEARLFAAFTRRRVFDVDDAIYVRKPRRLGEPADESAWRKRKFAATCRWVDVVAAGNDVLADVACITAKAVTVLPTSIDTAVYQTSTATPADPPTIAWIGSPENLIYLEMIRPALARLTARYPTLRMRVICSRFPDWAEVAVEPVIWSSAGGGTYRSHAVERRCLGARQMRFQTIAIHGRRAALCGLAGRRQHRGRRGWRQRLSCAQ